MNRPFLIVLLNLSFLMSLKVYASGPSLASAPLNKDPQCIVNANDPFEPHVRMTKGPDSGECINNTIRRSVTKLSSDIANKYFDELPNAIVVANVSHQNKFWVAQIPMDKISNMVLQSEHFPMMTKPMSIKIDHTQIRFDFSEPIKLINQELNSTEQATLNHIILSVENISPRGEAFDFFGGAKGHYNVAYRLVSMDDKYKWMVLENHDEVSQRKFNLNSQEMSAFLNEGINRGTKFGSARPYDSFKRNCSTEILNILNTIFDTRKYPVTGFISNSLPKHLDSIGVLDEEKMPSFNEEFGYLK